MSMGFNTRTGLALFLISLGTSLSASAASSAGSCPGAFDGEKEPTFLDLLHDQGPLSTDFYNNVRDNYLGASSKVQSAREQAQAMGLNGAALNGKILAEHNNYYTDSILEGYPVNQAQSGRCWDYAFLNVIRIKLIAKGILPPDFEFSQAMPYFYSQVEKANNWFVGLIKRMQPGIKRDTLLRAMEVDKAISGGDGGNFNFMQFMVLKMGLVPKNIMPETAASMNTDIITNELQETLGPIAMEMLNKFDSFNLKKGQKVSNAQLQELLNIKQKGMKVIYTKLASLLGSPPAPDEEFPFMGPDRVVRKFTPKTFAQEFFSVDPDDYVMVAVNPEIAPGKFYKVADANLGYDPDPKTRYDYKYLNVDSNRLKEIMKISIDNKEPIWVALDVVKDVDDSSGVMHPKIFNKNQVYGIKAEDQSPSLTLAQMMKLNILSADHAMVIHGYDQPGGPGTPIIKWLTENSWTGDVGTNGDFHMYEEWRQKYVYVIAVHKSALSAAELALTQGKPTILPADAGP